MLGRGSLPCAVLFVGEAPGISEDSLGQPFKGPAGKVLDSIIAQALPTGTRYALTNLVGCIPIGDEGIKSGEPEDESIKACAPRLVEFAAMADPKLVVCVGKLATLWLNTPYFRHAIKFEKEVRKVDIYHPAAILRANPAARSIMAKRCVVTVANVFREVFQGGSHAGNR